MLPHIGPRRALLGTVDVHGKPVPMGWSDPVTENPALGETEIWSSTTSPLMLTRSTSTGPIRDRRPAHVHSEDPFSARAVERGFKDTAIAYPGAVTRLRATFDRPGQFVWHCQCSNMKTTT